MHVNVDGMRCNNNEKIIQLVEFCEKNKVDVVILTETNVKWNIVTTSKMDRMFDELGRNKIIIHSDSPVYNVIENKQLLGR